MASGYLFELMSLEAIPVRVENYKFVVYQTFESDCIVENVGANLNVWNEKDETSGSSTMLQEYNAKLVENFFK